MTKKKPKDTQEEPRFEIKKRKPKEKPDFFQNIPSFKHPLADILNFPVQDSKTEPDIQNKNNLDIQNDFGQQAKEKTIGNPDKHYPDFQNKSTGNPDKLKSDIQTGNFGNPTDDNLDSKISENKTWISKENENLDSKKSKSKKPDIQKTEKTGTWAKYEKGRKAKGVFLRTSDEITKRFKQFCIGRDWDFSYGTEVAWNKLMTDLDSQTETDLDSLIALDDRRLKILYKSKPFIINLYLRYNSVFNEFSAGAKGKWAARWSPRDDEAAQRYNEISPSIVELGILQTQLNKGIGEGKIQTFKYYTEEIEKVLASGVSDEMLVTILEYHRQLWKAQTKREVDLSFLESTN